MGDKVRRKGWEERQSENVIKRWDKKKKISVQEEQGEEDMERSSPVSHFMYRDRKASDKNVFVPHFWL